MIQLRAYDPETDYPMLSQWWEGHGVPATPRECLPKLGMVAEWDKRESFAAFVSMDNSCGVCYLLWLVSNPAAAARIVVKCIAPTVELLQEIVGGMGYHTMLAMTHAESLSKYFRKLGFTTDSQMIRLHSTHL
jgi:hypothetical protein